MPSRFDVLFDNDEESEESEEEEEEENIITKSESCLNRYGGIIIPSYEDLSLVRSDEETVLHAVYGDDFVKKGALLNVHVRPPDIESEKIGSEVTLSVKLNNKYPYKQPIIKLRNVRGLNEKEETELMSILSERGRECAAAGSVMMCELVQSVEDYILIHNRDPTRANMSAWEQMMEREKNRQEQLMEREKQMQHLLLLDDAEDTTGITDVTVANLEVEKELIRQLQALEAASAARHLKKDISMPNDHGTGHDDESDLSSQENLDFDSPYSSSRYKTDFIELDLLGKGGGGEVMKVRNRLDRRFYAIKKIPLFESPKNDRYANYCTILNRKLKREVTTISKMTHKNIVRYYQAWVEGGAVTSPPQTEQLPEDQIISEQTSDNVLSTSSPAAGYWALPSTNVSTDFSSQSSHDNASQITHSKSNILHCSDIGFQFQSDEDALHEEEEEEDTFQNRKPSFSTDDEQDSFNSSNFQKPNGTQKLLYIQMEYCSTTLRHLIDDLTVFKMEAKDIFVWVRQILEALAYIHSQKIIHRDLKPSNIFLNSEGHILLGDFGLSRTRNSSVEQSSTNEIHAMTKKSHGASPEHSSLSLESLTGGVGTTFYRAPEQEGGPQQRNVEDRSYDIQADIFSFGIVLFEMFHPPFSTYMERANVLTKLRGDDAPSNTRKDALESSTYSSSEDNTDWKLKVADRFPDLLCKKLPENVQQIIIWCLNRSPRKRPLAKTLLSSDLIPVRLELEQLYLKEALRTLANPNSDSYERIVRAIFDQPLREQVEVTFDTDAAIRANKTTLQTNSHERLHSSAMSALAMTAASSVLKQAIHFDRQWKGGKMHGTILRATSAIAMRSATAAAISGSVDAGADPYVVETITQYFTHIFQSHGAVHLRAPLLRPRSYVDVHNHLSGHVELMNERGNVLMLPDDLTSNFARAVARGGIATVSFKRYDIAKVFHKSFAGGHPRESIEASFDIVFENNNISVEYVEAEAIMVLCQAMTFIVNEGDLVEGLRSLSIPSPFWYLRLTHTKLADSILDLCGVPLKDDVRKECFRMFTIFCSCPPGEVYRLVSGNRSRKNKHKHSKSGNSQATLSIDLFIENLTSNHNLPRESASRLRTFLSGCLPLSCKIDNCLNSLQESTNRLKLIDIQGDMDSKRSKRYVDIAKHLGSLRRLIQSIRAMGICPLIDVLTANKTKSSQGDSRVSPPAFISIDFGLRQRRRNIHGQIYFQAVILPDDYFVDVNFEDNEKLLSTQGAGVKIAEGGRYDDLVRKFRPPGNFGSVQFDHYTAAPIPVAIGIRLFIGKFIEWTHMNSRRDTLPCWNNLSEWINPHGAKINNKATADTIKHNLALNTVRCVVVSVNGMDNFSAMEERAHVASRLWLAGISAEYIPQSSVFMRMLNQGNLKSGVTGEFSNEWSLENLCKVCGILKIPFAIIVQPHLLKDKGAVRLRKIKLTSSNVSFSEEFVALSSLATIVKKHLASTSTTEEDVSDVDNDRTVLFDRQVTGSYKDQESLAAKTPQIDCIYVDADQYYGMEKLAKGDRGGYKTILKALKATRHRADSFMNDLVNPSSSAGGSHTIVVAVDLPFNIVRDFGTWAMSNEQGVTSRLASNNEMIEKYPSHKKVLKTLSFSLDSLIRRRIRSCSKDDCFDDDNSPVPAIYVFLYSTIDDRYDLVTIDLK